MNTVTLLQNMQKYSRQKGYSVVFIDLKSAYNTINRTRLFSMITRDRILLPDETSFLLKMYDSLYFKSSKGRHYLKNGVPQGAILSPLLFNIYMNDVLLHL